MPSKKELEQRIFNLHRDVLELKSQQPQFTYGYDPNWGISPFGPGYPTISVNHCLRLILDHLGLEIEETKADFKLKPKKK